MFYVFFKIEPDFILAGFVFFSTLFIYTWQRFAKIKSNQPFSGIRLQWMLTHSKFVEISLIFSGIATLFFLLLLQLNTLKIIIPFGMIAFLYVGKFPFKRLFNLRDIPLLKAHLVAGVWAGISVVLPAFQSTVFFTKEIWIFFSSMYCFILSLAIIFDVRDVDLDETQKLTVPQLLGKKGAVAVAVLINLISVFTLIFLRQELLLSLIFFSVLSAALFIIALNRKDDFYFSFWMDGLILFFSGLIIFATLF